MTFTRLILTVVMILVFAIGVGMAHYTIAAEAYRYTGRMMIPTEDLGKFEVQDYTVIMEGSTASLVEFDFLSDTKDFEYGEYHGNRTSDNARKLMLMVGVGFLVAWGIFEWVQYQRSK